jgi:molybdate transport system substrate-binding protein
MRMLPITLLALWVGSSACSPQRPTRAPEPLSIAAASNLADAFTSIGKAFTDQTQVPVTFNFGSTAQLAQQIDNGAPFDVFAAADTAHVDQLIAGGLIQPDTRRLYARGRLALWAPRWDTATLSPEALKDPRIRFVAIAQPGAAPYGKAAVDALTRLKLWQTLQPKIVYANNIQMAKQFTASGNADAAFTAWSLVFAEANAVRVDAALHAPLDQAAGIVTGSRNQRDAQRFLDFLTGKQGRAVLARYGYEFP